MISVLMLCTSFNVVLFMEDIYILVGSIGLAMTLVLLINVAFMVKRYKDKDRKYGA